MMLLIDAGNSHTKLRSWDGDTLETLPLLDQPAQLLRQFAGCRAYVSCVAKPSVREKLQQQLRDNDIQADWLQSPAQDLGLINAYPQPDKLGIDRWLALAAARAQAAASCCVIDAGTAITVDICDADGHHLGGLIAPGLKALNSALRQDTALPWVDAPVVQTNSRLLADNTDDALRLGALHSACGLIDRSYHLAQTVYQCDALYLTGGAARYLQPLLQTPVTLDDDLVFKGLALYAKKHSTNASDSL